MVPFYVTGQISINIFFLQLCRNNRTLSEVLEWLNFSLETGWLKNKTIFIRDCSSKLSSADIKSIYNTCSMQDENEVDVHFVCVELLSQRKLCVKFITLENMCVSNITRHCRFLTQKKIENI